MFYSHHSGSDMEHLQSWALDTPLPHSPLSCLLLPGYIALLSPESKSNPGLHVNNDLAFLQSFIMQVCIPSDTLFENLSREHSWLGKEGGWYTIDRWRLWTPTGWYGGTHVSMLFPHIIPPHLPPKVCPKCLCLLCCPASRIVSAIFLDSLSVH